MNKKKFVQKILNLLKIEYPVANCALVYETPLQLLIATMLSAQCTDVRVNLISGKLFENFKNSSEFANADVLRVQELIKTCGLYKTKSKNIVNMCKKLNESYGGKIPKTIEELTTLPGVGRKTANLILGEIYGKPAVIVDTHFSRVTRRLGLHNFKNPAKIESLMRDILPCEESTKFCHRIVLHGRKVCRARNPKCETCCLASYCPKKFENPFSNSNENLSKQNYVDYKPEGENS